MRIIIAWIVIILGLAFVMDESHVYTIDISTTIRIIDGFSIVLFGICIRQSSYIDSADKKILELQERVASLEKTRLQRAIKECESEIRSQ